MVESTLVFFPSLGSMEPVLTEEAILLDVSETRETLLEPSLVDVDHVRSETVDLLSAVRSLESTVLVPVFSSDVLALELLVLSVLGVTEGIVESTVDVRSFTGLTLPTLEVVLAFLLKLDPEASLIELVGVAVRPVPGV